MKRFISISLALVLAMSAMVGCSKNETQSQSSAQSQNSAVQSTSDDSSKKITVKLGIWPEDSLPDDIKMHEGFVKTFNKTHPNVTIQPAYYKYATDTFVSLAESGKLPTVFETWYTEPQKLINGDFVTDITDELKAQGWPVDSINPLVKDLLSKGGKIYGIPRDGYALGLMLNVDLFKQAGLVNADGTPQYPKTWDELAKTAQTIKQKTGQAGFCLLGKDNAAGWHFSNIAWGFGATFVTSENGKYAAHLNTPEAVQAMQYVKDLKWKYDCLTPDPTKEDWASGFVNLGTGTAAMYIAANDAVNQPTQVNGLPIEDLSLVPVPAGPKGQYSLAGGTPYMFAKNASSDEIKAALDYIEVMGKAPKATQATLDGIQADCKNKKSAGVPVIPRFPAWTDQTMLDAENKIIKQYSNVNMKLYENYYTAINTKGNLRLEEPGDAQSLYAELTKVIQAVITDKNADVQKLMDTAQSNYQKILDTTVNK